MSNKNKSETIAVVGMGYVGLPIAVSLAKEYETVIGFDINTKRVKELKDGSDRTCEVSQQDLAETTVRFTDNLDDICGTSFIVVTVPTPIDENNRPDLEPLRKASLSVGAKLTKNAVVVYESTVYPGVTEEICAPLLEQASGMKVGVDFFISYSPERVNPGDKDHTFEKIVKVVSADTPQTLERVAAVYERVVTAGIHRAASIRVAEAAKVIENVQRDLNIALMNELAIICDRLEIPTLDVLEAAGTKWNFLPFRPGLVGGHCIGVDPYYLTTRAEQAGYHPQVILAGRRINDKMGEYVARKCVKLLIQAGKQVNGARVGVLGVTFKEDIPDIRNSRVASLVTELCSYSVEVLLHDPYADGQEVCDEFGMALFEKDDIRDLDAVILAVPHQDYLADMPWLESLCRSAGLVLDVKSALLSQKWTTELLAWQL